jgi:DNA-binding beta-propeller fold protein YncE
MKRAITFVMLIAGLAAGQYIEARIPLPDSLGSVFSPDRIVYNPGRNRLYTGRMEDDWPLLALDAVTSARVGRLDFGYHEGRFDFDPAGNRLYMSQEYAGGDSWQILVIDGATDSVRARIGTGEYPAREFSFNPVSGKVLCLVGGEEEAERLLVLSSAGDSILAQMEVEVNPGVAAFSPVTNRHYVSSYGWLNVVDGAGDSLLPAVDIDGRANTLCYNPVNNTVYCGTDDDAVVVVDCSTSQVVGRVGTYADPVFIAVDPAAARLFCTDGERYLYVFDAATNQLIDTVTGLDEPGPVFTNPAHGRVYVGDWDGLHVIDARTLARLADFDRGYSALDMAFDGPGDRAFDVTESRGLVTLDGAADTVVSETPLGWRFHPTCFNPANGRAYGVDVSEYGLLALDGGLVGAPFHRPSTYFGPAVCCSLYNKLFVTGYRSLAAYDCTADTFAVVDSAPTQNDRGTIVHDAVTHRVYYSRTDSEVVVIDCRTNVVVARIELGWTPGKMQLDESRRRLYLAGGGGNYSDDTLVAAIDVDAGAVIWQARMRVWAKDIVLNPANNCLYCVGYVWQSVEDMAVIDCSLGTVVAELALPMGRPLTLACSPRSGRVYVACDPNGGPNDSLIAVVDCASQSVAGTVPMVGVPVYPYYDAGHDRLYVPVLGSRGNGSVAVVDCHTDSVSALLEPVYFDPYRNLPVIMEAGHGRMFTSAGGDIPLVTVIRDTSPVVVEEVVGGEARRERMPTIVRSVLALPRDMTEIRSGSLDHVPRPTLLDVTGRRVMSLQPGPNDVRHLAPGVYFVRAASGLERRASGVTKVVIAR